MVVILWAAKSSVNTFVQVNSYKWAFYELYGTIFVSTLHNTGHELKDDWDMVVGGRRSINGPKILVKEHRCVFRLELYPVIAPKVLSSKCTQ